MRRASLLVALLVVAALVAAVLFLGGDDDAGLVSSAGRVRPSTAAPAVGTTTAAVRAAPKRTRAAEDALPAADDAPKAITGSVRDPQADAPLAGATVLVSRRRTAPPTVSGVFDAELPGDAEFRAESAADGTFTVAVPDAGPWTVLGRMTGRADDVRVARAGETVTLLLAKAAEAEIEILGAPEGKPLAGAEVWICGHDFQGPPRGVVRADEQGVARVKWRMGDDSWVVRAKGYAHHFATAFFGKTRVYLAPGFGIRGVVRDAGGRPVPGAEIRVTGGKAQTWISAEDGTFAMDGLRSGQGGCAAEAWAKGFLDWHGALEFGDTEAVVVLRVAGTIRGTVLTPAGTPAAKATIGAGGEATDDAGRFELRNVRPGATELLASWLPPGGARADLLTGTARCELPDGGTVEDVVIRLESRSYVVLRVVDADGKPVPEFNAWVLGGDRADVKDGVAVMGVAAPVGTQRTAGVRGPGTGGVVAWQEVRTVATTQVSPRGAPTEVRLPPRKEVTVEFVGADGSALDPKVRVEATLGQDWWFARLATVRTTPHSATWTVDPARPCVLTVTAKDFAQVRRELTADELAAGRAIVRLSRGASMRARLVSPDSQAVTGAAVQLRSMATPATGATVVQVTRVEDGGVRGSLLRPGRWSLVVDWASTSIVREFEVTGDAEVDVGDVAIPPRVMLEGVVLRSDGRPCGGATVAFCDVATQSPGAAVSVREDGRFALELTDAARGALLVRKRGLGAAVVPLGDPSKPVTVRLAAEGTLDVRIVPPPGSSGSWSWRVETSDGTVKWQPEAEFRPGVTTGERRVVCGGVAAGPVTFVVEGSGWRFERAVVIVPGETVTATLGPDR